MRSSNLVIFLCLAGLGGLFIVIGVLARLGYLRWIYAMKGHPVLTSRRYVFTLVPMGLMTLFLGLLPFIPIEKEARGELVVYILFPLLIVTYVLAIWIPWWLKPKWLRWLEKEHGDIIHLLWEDVRQDRWGWERRVRTQANLEAWVAKVRHKHGLG